MNTRSALAFSPGAAGPLLSEPEPPWQDRALCAQTDPEAFFPEKGGSTREAKRVCRSCEVKAECLEYALANDERFGIWGGMSERERRRIKRPDTAPALRRCRSGKHVLTPENTLGGGRCHACSLAYDRSRYGKAAAA